MKKDFNLRNYLKYDFAEYIPENGYPTINEERKRQYKELTLLFFNSNGNIRTVNHAMILTYIFGLYEKNGISAEKQTLRSFYKKNNPYPCKKATEKTLATLNNIASKAAEIVGGKPKITLPNEYKPTYYVVEWEGIDPNIKNNFYAWLKLVKPLDNEKNSYLYRKHCLNSTIANTMMIFIFLTSTLYGEYFPKLEDKCNIFGVPDSGTLPHYIKSL